MTKQFAAQYLEDFVRLATPTEAVISQLGELKNAMQEVSEKGGKTIIVGNGGSAAIASHFSVDVTKNARVRCVNFNESDLITCFANDYGYEHWVEKAVEFYGDPGDLFIAISSSGSSRNILNGVTAAKNVGCTKIATFSGLDASNPLRKCGDINFWVDSKAYNHVENIHQLWLLTVVDMLIGKAEYAASPDSE